MRQTLAKCQYPIKVIAFDLDKTLVRTLSLHNDEQPQPEQYEDGYFMFFDDDIDNTADTQFNIVIEESGAGGELQTLSYDMSYYFK